MDFKSIYLNRGWSFFPLPLRSKDPIVKWGVYQDRLPTPEEAAGWKNCNIAIVTGPISNLAVIEADGPEGLVNLKRLGVYSPVQAKSRNGVHMYFKYPRSGVKNSQSKIAPNVDVRGNGGYIMAAPSIHPTGVPYMWSCPNLSAELPEFPEACLVSDLPAAVKPLNQAGWITSALDGLAEGRTPRLAKVIGKMINDKWTPNDAFTVLKPHAEAVNYDLNKLTAMIADMWGRYEKPESKTSGEEGFDFTGYFEELSHRLHAGELGLCTGFKPLDDVIGEFQKGELATFAARTGFGKTTFALTVSEYLRARGFRVVYFSTELHKNRVMDKLACIAKRIPIFDITHGRHAQYTDRLLEYQKEFESNPIIIDDSHTPSTEHVKGIIGRGGFDLFVFDHINNVGHDRAIVANYVAKLKEIARDANMAGLILAQLNEPPRNPKTGEEMPSLRSDVREAKEIIMYSNVFGYLTNPFTVKGSMQPVEFHMAKARYGTGGQDDVVTLICDKINSIYLEEKR